MSEAQTTRAPRQLKIVGILAILWHLIGAVDYTMTETKNEAYMGQFSPEQIEYFTSFPAWMIALWAVAVWGGLLASIFLLMRKKLAMPIFIVSFVCMIATTIYQYSTGMAAVTGAGGVFFSVLIFAVALGLIIYSRNMIRKGVLT